jgi:hypothetical protein
LHSRTSDDEFVSEPSSSSSDSDTNDPTSSIPLPFHLKPKVSTEGEPVPLATQINRQNGLPPMLPPKAQVRVPLHAPKNKEGQGHQKQKQQQLQQHFLHGINVESCQNLLSIPDPPTPGKVNRRRQSSPGPMLQPLPFDDLTHSSKANQQKTNADDSRLHTIHVKIKAPRGVSLTFLQCWRPTWTPFPVVAVMVTMKLVREGATETVTERSYSVQLAHRSPDDYVETVRCGMSVRKRRRSEALPFRAIPTSRARCYNFTFMTYKKCTRGSQKEERTHASMEQR